MIELFTWATPNGARPAIMLEEAGLPYTVRLIDIAAGAQFSPKFLAISPNSKIPALIDCDATNGRRVPAEKSGALLGGGGRRRDEALSWLFWSTSGLGPTFGRFLQQVSTHGGQSEPDAVGRKITRLMRVLERRVFHRRYRASFAWVNLAVPTIMAQLGEELEMIPCIYRWLESINAWAPVKRGLQPCKVVLRRNATHSTEPFRRTTRNWRSAGALTRFRPDPSFQR
jgi:GSH-dependent disulfide-bond oxidoreductase